MSRSWTCFARAITAWLCFVFPAFADGHSAPGILISFEGGLAGDNVGAVIRILAQLHHLPTTHHVVRQGETVCGILVSEHYPAPCGHILSVVSNLNPNGHVLRKGLSIGDDLILPDLQITSYQTQRTFSTDKPQQVGVATDLQHSWEALSSQLIKKSEALLAVNYLAYEIYLPTRDDADSRMIVSHLEHVRSSNVLINLLEEHPVHTSVYSAEADVQNRCTAETIAGMRYFYRDFADGDQDAESAITVPAAPAAVQVYLIAGELQNSPNLRPALPQGNTGPWTCKWAQLTVANHATHLAGIIGSRDNGFGFVGLAPTSNLKSFPWFRPDPNDASQAIPYDPDRVSELEALLRKNEWVHSLPLRVYLAAVSFDRYNGDLSADEQLTNKDSRWTQHPAKEIKELRPLLITAAGQGSPTVHIGPTSPYFPQNLGDLENVLVVTACAVCGRGQVQSLYASAYVPNAEPGFIQVAAPGGEAIPGWISTDDLGAGLGTSQASAYAAGVAASMISFYPQLYTEARDVKLRLQVTSRPMEPLSDGSLNPDAAKIVAGIVDPVVALLDPTKDWLKVNGAWHATLIKSWSEKLITFADGNRGYHTAESDDIFRIMEAPVHPAGRNIWTVYIDGSHANDGVLGSVKRVDLVSPVGTPSITLCTGETIPLDKVQDLIVSMTGVQANACPTW